MTSNSRKKSSIVAKQWVLISGPSTINPTIFGPFRQHWVVRLLVPFGPNGPKDQETWTRPTLHQNRPCKSFRWKKEVFKCVNVHWKNLISSYQSLSDHMYKFNWVYAHTRNLVFFFDHTSSNVYFWNIFFVININNRCGWAPCKSQIMHPPLLQKPLHHNTCKKWPKTFFMAKPFFGSQICRLFGSQNNSMAPPLLEKKNLVSNSKYDFGSQNGSQWRCSSGSYEHL